jgi:hypothetical protein
MINSNAGHPRSLSHPNTLTGSSAFTLRSLALSMSSGRFGVGKSQPASKPERQQSVCSGPIGFAVERVFAGRYADFRPGQVVRLAPVFEKLATLWRKKHAVEVALLSRKVGEYAPERHLQAHPDIPVATISTKAYAHLTPGEMRTLAQDAMAAAFAKHGGVIVNFGSGVTVTLSKKGAIHATHLGDKHRPFIATFALAGKIDELIQNGVVADSYRSKKDGPLTTIHRLYSAAMIDGKPYRVKLTLMQSSTEEASQRGAWYYDQSMTEVEPLAPAGWMPQKESALSAATGEHPLVGRGTFSVAQLLQGVERDSDGRAFNFSGPMLSRAVSPAPTSAKTADDIIKQKARTSAPIDFLTRKAVQAVGLDKLTTDVYDKAGFLLDRYTPETIKAGMVSDYGFPESVLDQRAIMQGRQRQQIRAAGALLEKLATLTRAESRVAYQWMNADDPQSSDYFLDQLPPESIKTLSVGGEDLEEMLANLVASEVRHGKPRKDKRNNVYRPNQTRARRLLPGPCQERARRKGLQNLQQ